MPDGTGQQVSRRVPAERIHFIEHGIKVLDGSFASPSNAHYLLTRAACLIAPGDYERRCIARLQLIDFERAPVAEQHRLCVSRQRIVDTGWCTVSKLFARESDLVNA